VLELLSLTLTEIKRVFLSSLILGSVQNAEEREQRRFLEGKKKREKIYTEIEK
jgi:hypothetical protein